MKSFAAFSLAIVALLASVSAHGHDHGKQDEPAAPKPVECGYVDSFGYVYDLSPLRNPAMGAYAFPDGSTNIYFNVCGDLSELPETPCHNSPAGLCATQNDVEGTQVNGGNASTAVFSDNVEALEANRAGVTLTYSGGDVCALSKTGERWSTQLNLICPQSENIGLAISSFSVSEADPCVIQLNLTSVFACPITQNPQEDMWFPVMTWVMAFMATLLCCAACCACTRRCRARRCVRRQMDRVYSAPVATNGEYSMVSTSESPIIVAPSAPAVTPETAQLYYPQIPQYYEASFQPMMASMYPYAQAPVASAPSNVVAMGAIRTPVRAASGSTVTDEQLARALQAQYDNEASLV